MKDSEVMDIFLNYNIIRITSLGKFREFHRLCSIGNLVEAASVLVLLMVDGLASKKYEI